MNNTKVQPHKLLGFFLINGIVSFFISLFYFSSAQPALELMYGVGTMLGQASVIYLVIAGLFGLLNRLPLLNRLLYFLAPTVATFGWVFLIIDIKIYSLFKNHFNGLALNILTTPGGWESLDIKIFEIILFGVLTLAVLVFQFYFFWAFNQKWDLQRIDSKLRKPHRIYLLGFLPFLISSCIYAYGDLYDVPQIKRAHDIVPFHQPVTIKSAFEKVFGFLPTPKVSMKVKASGSLLYPRQPLQFSQLNDKPFNVVWIVIDCWRIAAFDPKISPHIYEFSKNAQSFVNHHAGGNATRNGLFSLFYGIYSSYWRKVLAENKSPVLFDRMQELGYEFSILSNKPLTFPEFRKTAFANLNEYIVDVHEPKQSWQRDELIIGKTNEFIKKTHSKPFFSFTFLDAAHSHYSYPAEETVFQPTLHSYNYSLLTDEQKRVDLKNAYQNAIHFIDNRLQSIFETINNSSLKENTIVLITGDHGQEFMEHGYTGHSGAFTREQTMVPLVLYWPGRMAKTYEHFSTHFDVVPTFMEHLGAINPTDDYSLGHSLFDEKAHQYSLACNWSRCAIMDRDGWIIFGAPGHSATYLQFRNENYEVISKSEGLNDKRSLLMSEVMRKMGQFSR